MAWNVALDLPPAGTQFNAILNLGALSYYDTQQMFLNVLKQAGTNAPVYSAWTAYDGSGAGTGEEAYLEQILDANGYPTTLTLSTPPSGGQVFTQLGSAVFVNIGAGPGVVNAYPADTYRFQWQGKGTIVFGGDVKVLANASAGCTISGLQVTSTNAWGTTNSVTLQGTGGTVLSPTTAGIKWNVTAVPDSANYMKAMTCVQSSLASLFDGGEIFHPNFIAALSLTKPYALRCMDTLQTNNQVQHARYLGYVFSTAPTSGTALPPLSAAWPEQSGQRRITLATGEELLATFTTGSTTVTSTTNPTVTASSGTVPSGELTTDFFWFGYDSWSTRPQLEDLTYTTNKGAPFEVGLLLAKKISCQYPWLNVPPQFQSADWASLAALVVSILGTGQKAFTEYSNETWNGAFNAYHWLLCKSQFLWGTADAGSYIGMSTALVADQFATTAGNPGFDNSFIVLMAGQAANTGWLTAELTAASWASTHPYLRVSASGQKTIKGTCIAPYAGNGPIWSADYTLIQAQGDPVGTFLSTFTAGVVGGNTYHDNTGAALPVGGWFAKAAGYVTSTVSALASYGGLPVYCYEGDGQVDDSSGAQASFLTSAARDSRMAALTQLYLETMAAAGCIPAHYNFCGPFGNYTWGLLESVMQPVSPLSSAPAKFQGFCNYVNNG